MAHGITSTDSGFTVREPAWHGLFPTLKRHPANWREAKKAAGLTWRVTQEPAYRTLTPALRASPGRTSGQGVFLPVEGYKLNVREDTGVVLGIVTDRYALMQIDDAFGFMSELLGTDAKFETGGSIGGGKRVFLVVKAAEVEWLEVGGDRTDLFINLFTSFDGTSATNVLTTPVRTVCQNTWDAALASAVNRFAIRHVGDPSTRLHEARQALDLSIDCGKQFKKWGDRLAKQRIAERKVLKIAEELWPAEGTDRSVKSAQRRREAVVHLFLEGTQGPRGITTVGNAPGSKWCAANAFLEHIEWDAKVRTDHGRFVRHIEDPEGLKRRAVEAVVQA